MPDGWIRGTLRDQLDLCRNGLVCRQDADPVEGLPITRIETISEGKINWHRVGYVSREDVKPQYLLRRGDILLSHINSIKHIGKVAQKTDDRPLLHGMNLMVLRFAQHLDPGFAFATMASHRTKAYMESRAKKAVNQASINSQDIYALTILLPPLPEQRAIAAVLDSIDEAIERTEAVIAATERLRDALLHELLTRGVPGWHSEWKEALGIGTMPACWEVVRLGEVAEVVMGQSPSGQHCNRSGYGTPLLNGPTEFARVHPIPAQWTTAPAKMASCGDLLFCVRGATTGKMNWANCNYAIGRGVAALRHRAGTRYQRYLRALVERMLPRLLTTVTGSTFPNLGRDEISNLRVLNPPLPEQQAIVAVLDSVGKPIDRVREGRDVLQSFRAAASDALLTGRVRTAVHSDI